jgi:signal transduction histidine kinase
MIGLVAAPPRWLRPDLVAYAGLTAATGLVSLVFIDAGRARWMAVILFGAYGVLLGLLPRVENNPRRAQLYLAAQAAVIVCLAILQQGLFTFIFLAIILSVQAALVVPLRTAVLWVALFMLLTLVSAVVADGWRGTLNAVLNMLGYPVALTFGVVMRRAQDAQRHSQQLLADLQAAHQQLQDFTGQAKQLAVAEERNRLARELHDSVKQQRCAAHLQISTARTLLTRDPAATGAHLDEAERLASLAQRELSGLIHALRPAALEGQALADALQQHVAEWSRQSLIVAALQLSKEQVLPLDREQALFRVAQEALNNIARHSRATQAQVILRYEPGAAVLFIADNGRGFEPNLANHQGVGLSSMRERIEALGGSLQLSSQPGGGTAIIAECPTSPAA